LIGCFFFVWLPVTLRYHYKLVIKPSRFLNLNAYIFLKILNFQILVFYSFHKKIRICVRDSDFFISSFYEERYYFKTNSNYINKLASFFTAIKAFSNGKKFRSCNWLNKVPANNFASALGSISWKTLLMVVTVSSRAIFTICQS